MSLKRNVAKVMGISLLAGGAYYSILRLGNVEIAYEDGPVLYQLGGKNYEQLSSGEYEARKRLLLQDWDNVRKYWLTRNVGDVAAAHLVVVDGSQPYACMESDRIGRKTYPDKADIYYCGATSSVVVSRGAIHRAGSGDVTTKPINPGTELKVGIAHEMGHVVQVALNTPNTGIANIELQADCLAGVALQGVYASAVDEVRSTRAYVVGDKEHGSDTQRLDSFLRGGIGSDCGISLEPSKP